MNQTAPKMGKLADFQKVYLPLFGRIIVSQLFLFLVQMVVIMGVMFAVASFFGDTMLEITGKPFVYVSLLLYSIAEFFLTLYFFRKTLNKVYKGVRLTIQNSQDFKKETRRMWLKIFLIGKISSWLLLQIIILMTHAKLDRASGSLPYLIIVGLLLYRSLGKKQSGGYTLALETVSA